ncbi:hypothetical protein CBR_g37083 [Chara braunii]|uniref:Protein kinase domain-containing protein n=1 Tax=Chara braunii TaxID=69332 RepID=A0A388LM19_CHABU|nr:hypothetical protein CBR_g37083 [Chara braunii]|eukprot:GBG83369.1 hypothetical protein CBR_g37083 [Chara braunii]
MWDTNSMAVLQTFYKSQTLRGAKGRVVTSLRFCASRPQTSLLIAGHASGTIQVWDYQRKECMATLDVHEQKVVQAFFHPHLPYILSASCDGTVMAWSDSDYQLQYTLCSGLTGLSDGILCRNDSMLGLYSKEEALRFITLEHNGPKRNDFENSVKMEVGNAIEESDKRLWFEKTDAHSIKSLVAELISVRVKRRALEEGLEKERETHAQRMNEVESELSDVRTERQVLGVRFETLQEEHEREKGMLLERVDELGSQITNLMTEREELKERMERSKVRIQELESRLEMDGGVGERSERFDGVPSVVPQVEFLHPLREFSLDELKTATNDFHDDSKVEHRHYGCVYVGKTTPVVVKRFDGGNNMTRDKHVQLTRDFVDLLKSLEHPHLQKLLGVCYGGNCLVYEHMASGSVKEWISSIEGSRRGFLPWCVRLRIMAQVAQALAFLHSSKSLGGGPIIHRAIKPENILLGTSNLVAKLAEVDAALLAPDSKDVDAAPGMPMSNRADAQYMAPEFLHREVFTQQTDIYAFGITILEILTGKFKDAFGSMEDAVDDPAVFGSTLDPNAGSWDVQLAMEAAQVGLRCANPNRRLRPSMRTGEGAILPALESIASKVELADSIEDVRRMSLCE